MALVRYQRQPRFVFAPPHAAELSRFDPYGVLALPPEDPHALLHALAAAGGDVDAVATGAARAKLAARTTDVRDAYRDLAARFHPDAAGGSGDGAPRVLCSWMSRLDHFAAVAAAYAVLIDAHSAAAYLLAAQEGRAASGGDDDGSAATTGRGADRAARASRSHRRAAALREREGMAQLIGAAQAAQAARQRTSGDGLFIDLALYGDARAIARVAAACGGVAADARTGAVRGEPAVIDVTGQLAALVEVVVGPGGHGTSVQLALPPCSKRALDGVWDPCEGFPCTLFVRYRFLGRVHEVAVGDDEPLKCPLKRHLVSQTASAAAPPQPAPPQQGAVARDGRAGAAAADSQALPATATTTGRGGSRVRTFGRELNGGDAAGLRSGKAESAPPAAETDAESPRAAGSAHPRRASDIGGSGGGSGGGMGASTPNAQSAAAPASAPAPPADDADVVTYTRGVDGAGNVVIVQSRGRGTEAAAAAAAAAASAVVRAAGRRAGAGVGRGAHRRGGGAGSGEGAEARRRRGVGTAHAGTDAHEATAAVAAGLAAAARGDSAGSGGGSAVPSSPWTSAGAAAAALVVGGAVAVAYVLWSHQRVGGARTDRNAAGAAVQAVTHELIG